MTTPIPARPATAPTAVILATIAVLLAGPSLAAAETPGLERCAGITDAAERLACYDRLAASSATPEPPAAPAAQPDPVEPAAHADQTPQPAAAATVVPEAPPAAADFGAETLPQQKAADTEPRSLRARVPGHFEGWQKNTLFKLDNGQVWRCVDDRSVYYVAEDPEVTIKRGLFGSYWLSVEGLNSRARVRREQ